MPQKLIIQTSPRAVAAMRRPIAALFCLTCLLVASPSWAETEIGDVRSVKVWAYGTPSGGKRGGLYESDAVYADETVETANEGALHVVFRDDTDFRLGSASRAVLDRFVYNADSHAGVLSLSLLKGVFRYTSGKLAKRGVKIATPVALIGIRGTDFTVSVADDGATEVAVAEGEVEITPLGGGAAANVTAGQVAAVANPVADATVNTGTAASDPGLQDQSDTDAGEADGDGGDGDGGGGH
jgi:hypothetical protein